MIKPEAILFWASKNEFTISECESLAKDLDAFDTMTFDLVGPTGRKSARWMDAYYGIFELDGHESAFQARQFLYVPDVHCENLQFPASADTHPKGGDAKQGSVHG